MIVVETSLQGRTHIQEGVPCQDASHGCVSPDGSVVLAVADGVGSYPHAKEASHIAVRAVTDYWKNYHSAFRDGASVQSALIASFNYALDQIQSQKTKPWEDGWQTTLDALIIARNRLHFLHCGDGAIYVSRDDGSFEALTSAQNEEDGLHVIPLGRGMDAWVFGSVPLEDICSVMMVTDGIRSAIEDPGKGGGLQADLMKKLMDPSLPGNMQFNDSKGGAAYLRSLLLAENGLDGGFAHVTDDMTVVCAFIREAKPGSPEPHEESPDASEHEGKEDVAVARDMDPGPAEEAAVQNEDDTHGLGGHHPLPGNFPIARKGLLFFVLLLMLGIALVVSMMIRARKPAQETNETLVQTTSPSHNPDLVYPRQQKLWFPSHTVTEH